MARRPIRPLLLGLALLLSCSFGAGGAFTRPPVACDPPFISGAHGVQTPIRRRRWLSAKQAARAPAPPPLKLLWADEFNAKGSKLDPAKWDIMTGDGTQFGLPPGWGNNELENYTTRATNVRVEGGNLVLQAQAEPAGSPYGPFTSGRVRTSGRFSIAPSTDFPLIRIEARIKLPKGAGLWPAFWMLPEGWIYGTYPLSGEMDIVEASNDMAYCVGSLHYGGEGDHQMDSDGTAVQLGGTYRTYALEWEARAMRWYLDGQQFHSAYSSQGATVQGGWWSAGGTGPAGNAPFDAPFHILLNMALGGDFTQADRSTVAATLASGPKKMLVDWVRVYGRPAATQATAKARG